MTTNNSTCKYCKNATQDFEHLLITCPVTKLEEDYQTAHACEDKFKNWLEQIHVNV